MGTRTSSPDHTQMARPPWPVLALGLGAVLAAMAFRVRLGHGLPLWLDETWTGMIATQPDWTSFWREAWLDCNPPFYYAVMAVWTSFFGASDIALRLPSLIFMALAALLPLLVQVPGLSHRARLIWVVLLCLWAPGMEIALDARGYGLLFFLSVGQAIAFLHLMVTPTRPAAWRWALLASLAGLTHYHALLIGGLQGLALLAWHKKTALRLWPAALAFVPAFGWLAIHAPRLVDYARPDIAWYEPLTASLGSSFLRYAFGFASWMWAGLVAFLILTALFAGRGSTPARAERAACIVLIVCGLLALGIELLLGSMRPMLTDRYLVPLVPALLLGLIYAIRADAAWGKWRGLGLLTLYVLSLDVAALRTQLEAKTSYGFAKASAHVAQSSATQLVFSWDHPSSPILAPASLAKLGSFFLERAGRPLPTKIVQLRPREDGNARLAAIAGPDGAVIWIYNRARESAARTHPPRLDAWPMRSCRWYRGVWVGTLACGPVRPISPPIAK